VKLVMFPHPDSQMPQLELTQIHGDNVTNPRQNDHSAHPLLDDYLKSMPSLAKKYESGSYGNLSGDAAKEALSLELTNIYKEAGGGDASKQAEDTFQNAINNQFKNDGSSLHLDTANFLGKKGYYALVDQSDNRGTGLLRADGPAYKAEAAPTTSDSSKAAEVPNSSDGTQQNKLPEISKASEQLYNRAAEDAALSMMLGHLTSDEKASSIVDAMNKAGVKSQADVERFENTLRNKLGKNGVVTPVSEGTGMFASEVEGRFDVNSGRGETLGVVYKMGDNGKLQVPKGN
jgi:hypothetical protein